MQGRETKDEWKISEKEGKKLRKDGRKETNTQK
jgi:hypothetical protein